MGKGVRAARIGRSKETRVGTNNREEGETGRKKQDEKLRKGGEKVQE